jgi:acetyl esterase/lipase
MARLTRRGFITASSALAAAPALSALKVSAQGPAPDIGNLKVEKDIVFAKAGSMDLKLDVYQPAAGVTSKRTAIIHLFGGGFFSGNKSAGYIINDIKALAPKGYTNISANYRLSKEGFWPAQIHDVKAAIRWTLLAAGTNGKPEFEGDLGTTGVSSDVNASIGVYPLASAQIAGSLWPQGQATPEAIAAASPTTYISDKFAPTIFVHGTNDNTVPVTSSVDFFTKLHALKVPTTLTLIQGADHAFDNNAPDAVELMATSIDLFLDRLLINPKPYPSFGGGGGGRGGRGGGRGAAPGAGRGQ